METRGSVDLYWLPLGAGGRSVRFNGHVYEAFMSRLQRRPARDLYHSALVVWLGGDRYIVEMAPVLGGSEGERGVVAEGAVGARLAGRPRLFRYEVRRWCGGEIPDVEEAVDSPRRLKDGPEAARRVLDLLPHVPTPVWGRDELGAGDMWNSNSVVAWVLARSGIDADRIEPPPRGRAPGWRAGLVAAQAAASPHCAAAHSTSTCAAASSSPTAGSVGTSSVGTGRADAHA